MTVLVASTRSGDGKTTLTSGILSAMKRRGLDTAPFKCGPDYLDPLHLAAAAGRPTYNLDPFLTGGEEGVLRSFERGIRGIESPRAVIEGVMGLFDGITPDSDEGSSAEIARMTGARVVLLVPPEGTSRTALVAARGLIERLGEDRLLGIVFSRVRSVRHASSLDKAARSLDLPILGSIPANEDMRLPSRHLGLVRPDGEDSSERIAGIIEENLDLDTIINASIVTDLPGPGILPARRGGPRYRIAVPEDDAFHFAYRENLDLIEEAGGEIVTFSPLSDEALPAGIDALYLTGGYPEVHAERLAANRGMLASIASFAGSGGVVLAECGGLILLGDSLQRGKTKYAMAGVVPVDIVLRDRLVTLGYRFARTTLPSILGPPDTSIRGHEFRYSEICGGGDGLGAIEISRPDGGIIGRAGFARGNLFASYLHIHFAASPEVAERLLSSR